MSQTYFVLQLLGGIAFLIGTTAFLYAMSQDRRGGKLHRISAAIARRRGETMLREEPLRPQSVVLFYRAQHVSTGRVFPGHHLFIPPGSLWLGTTVSSSTATKCGVPGASAMKLPAGIAFALLGSAVSPIPIQKVPDITVKSPAFESVCGGNRSDHPRLPHRGESAAPPT
jgi:hypothetical protein